MAERMALTKAPAGRAGVVIEIHGGPELADRLRALGIRPGAAIAKVADSLGRGPIVVRHGRSTTALGRGICNKIIIEVHP